MHMMRKGQVKRLGGRDALAKYSYRERPGGGIIAMRTSARLTPVLRKGRP